MKWLAEKGWDEADAIKQAAGDKGSKVHAAIEDILVGKTVKIDDKYLNHSTEKEEELTPREYECVMSFVAWLNEVNPEIISNGIALCAPCHRWFDVSASKIEAALFIEKMIGKEKMVELNELASSKNAKPWLVGDLEKKLAELQSRQ